MDHNAQKKRTKKMTAPLQLLPHWEYMCIHHLHNHRLMAAQLAVAKIDIQHLLFHPVPKKLMTAKILNQEESACPIFLRLGGQ
jgi:hypothetical protein